VGINQGQLIPKDSVQIVLKKWISLMMPIIPRNAAEAIALSIQRVCPFLGGPGALHVAKHPWGEA
jgi:hypothetical protein